MRTHVRKSAAVMAALEQAANCGWVTVDTARVCRRQLTDEAASHVSMSSAFVVSTRLVASSLVAPPSTRPRICTVCSLAQAAPILHPGGDPGKIVVGNLPRTITKAQIAAHFSSCGIVRHVILIRSHESVEANRGFCFIFYGGNDDEAQASASRAVQRLQGQLLAGQRLRIKLDDGRRERQLAQRLATGGASDDERSTWHAQRKEASLKFRAAVEVSESTVEDVVEAFGAIPKPRHGDWSLLIKFHARRGSKHSARSAFEAMRAQGIAPSAHSFTSLVHAYCRAGDLSSAVRCVHEMRSEGVPPTEVTFGCLISGFAKARDLSSAQFWYSEFEASGLESSAAVTSNLIHAYCLSGEVEPAHQIIRQQIATGLEVPLPAFNTVINVAARQGREDTCHALMAQIKRGDMASAVAITKEMERGGVPRDPHVTSMLLHGFLRAGNTKEAMRVCDGLLRERGEGGASVDKVLFNGLLHALCRGGEVEHAVALLRRLGSAADVYSYTAVVGGLAESGRLEEAGRMMEEMRGASCPPNAATLNAVVGGMVKHNQVKAAEELVTSFISSGERPSLPLFTTLINAAALQGDVSKAVQNFELISEHHLVPDVGAWGALLKACCKGGRMQTATAVKKAMEVAGMEATIAIYNIIMDGWARQGAVWEAAELKKEMETRDVHPDTRTRSLFIRACCRAGDMEQGEGVLTEMEAVGDVPTVHVYTTLVKGWAGAGYPDRVWRVYERLRRTGVDPDGPFYHCLITCLIERCNAVIEGRLRRAAEDMRGQGFRADATTSRHWLKGLPLGVADSTREAILALLPPEFGVENDDRSALHVDAGRVTDVWGEDGEERRSMEL